MARPVADKPRADCLLRFRSPTRSNPLVRLGSSTTVEFGSGEDFQARRDAKRIQGFTNQWGIYNKYPSFIDNEDITCMWNMKYQYSNDRKYVWVKLVFPTHPRKLERKNMGIHPRNEEVNCKNVVLHITDNATQCARYQDWNENLHCFSKANGKNGVPDKTVGKRSAGGSVRVIRRRGIINRCSTLNGKATAVYNATAGKWVVRSGDRRDKGNRIG
ncbi:hypothetical protein B0H14DRAFT_3148116 [Mycena olivaceomarginata]|nr:hypothetical protein B0H14DRAFT_3148116 [Mycena olivaceomarginata]